MIIFQMCVDNCDIYQRCLLKNIQFDMFRIQDFNILFIL